MAGDAAVAYCWTAGPAAYSQSMRYELARWICTKAAACLVCLQPLARMLFASAKARLKDAVV